MKAATFNGTQIFQPSPEVNQIWKSTTNNHKFKIVKVYTEMALCEQENGSRFDLGFGWFDGVVYICIGTVKQNPS